MSWRDDLFSFLFKSSEYSNYTVSEQEFRAGGVAGIGYGVYSWEDMRGDEGIQFIPFLASVAAGEAVNNQMASYLGRVLNIEGNILAAAGGRLAAVASGVGVGVSVYEVLKANPVGEGGDLMLPTNRYALNRFAAEFFGDFNDTSLRAFLGDIDTAPTSTFANPGNYIVQEYIDHSPDPLGTNSRRADRLIVIDPRNDLMVEFGQRPEGSVYARELPQGGSIWTRSFDSNTWINQGSNTSSVPGVPNLETHPSAIDVDTIIRDAEQSGQPSIEQCFGRGTLITMADGSCKKIEEVVVDDRVLSSDRHGNLVPGRVSKVWSNQAPHVLDFHGTIVTPGHMYERSDEPYQGQYQPLVKILMEDGALIRVDGGLVRASTGCVLGSDGDKVVWAVAGNEQGDGSVRVRELGRIRLGTRYITHAGYDISVMDMIATAGGIVGMDGLVRLHGCGQGRPFHWPFADRLPKPEDYILQRSGVDLRDICVSDERVAAGS